MRREVVIVLGVLVPFAVLVGAGFSFSPQLSLPGGERKGEGLIPAQVARRRPDPLPANAGNFLPPELAAPLRAVFPEVHRCFADQHFKRGHEVRVRFTPTRDGGFDQVQVDEQNPYLASCLEDVFAEVRWQPSGAETWAPAMHTFSYDPSSD